MKIDIVSVTIEKDAAGAKPSPRDDSARSEQGRAFDKAVQGVAPGRGKTDAARTQAGASDAEETAAEPSAEDDAALAGASEAATPTADARTLQALLGLLGTQAQAAAKVAADAAAPDGEAAADAELAASLRAAAVLAGAGETTEGATKPTKALRLDVLHMETHFEPHQDGMVLVSGDAPKAAGSDAVASARLASEGTDRLAVLLGDGARTGTAKADAAAGGANATSDDPAGEGTDSGTQTASGVRLRFDEALAQLGRSGRDGAGAGRGGSAATEIAAARAETRGTEKVAASSSVVLPEVGGLATQVARPILDALGPAPAAPGTPTSAPGETHLRMRAGGAAMKTLTIQLQPEHLGTLEVSMRLTDGKLTLELAASQADTAVLLADDRGTLRKVLEQAGFSLDDAAITVVTRDAAPAASRSADSGSAGGQGSDARSSDPQSQRGAGGEGASGRGSRGETGRQPGEAPSRDGPSLERRSGAHYL